MSDLDRAIEAGDVYDVTHLAAAVGIGPVPVVLTGAVMAMVEDGWIAEERDGGVALIANQEEFDRYRIFHILSTLGLAMNATPEASRLTFTVLIGGEEQELCSVIGPDDEGNPVIIVDYAED